MKKQLISTLLTAALVVSAVVPASAATPAGPQSTGSGTVYAPTEIIDVVVPTSVKIAFNPLKVAVKNDDFNANTEILSGTYAIQNRSTVPMQVAAAFKVTAGDASIVSAEQIVTDNAATTKLPTKAEFSLDVVTTANGASPTLPVAPAAKASGDASDSRADVSMDGNASTNKIALGKASAVPTSLTTAATLKFMLAKGPYTAVYDAESNDITYKANAKGTYDSVAFKFTGTTLTNASLWDKVKTAPKVDVTYTLTQSTDAQYAATPFNPNSKSLVQETADVKFTINKTAGKFTFAGEPKVTMDKNDSSQPADSNKVSVQSLIKGSKAVSYKMNDFGTYAPETDKNGVVSYTYTLPTDKEANNLEAGFYKVTVGGQTFILQVS